MNGYWFCSTCDDVVLFRSPVGRWDLKAGEECPVCHHRSLDWMEPGAAMKMETPVTRVHIFVKRGVTPERAGVEFEKIRTALERDFKPGVEERK